MGKNIRVALDLGRSVYKAALSNSHTCSVTSGLALIGSSEYERGIERANDDGLGFMLCDGNAYVIGPDAIYYRQPVDQSTADRYTRNNIGLVAANMILRLLSQEYSRQRVFEVDVIISHPPRDADYRDKLKNALMGDWNIENAGNRYQIRIERVWTEDEPVAILMNTLLTADGRNYANPRIAEGQAYVLDGGGKTLDGAATYKDGSINQARVNSEYIGVNDTLRQFGDAVRTSYPDYFQGVKSIDPQVLAEAFITGEFRGGKTLDVRSEAKREREAYLNSVVDFARNYSGGLINYTTLIIGGGAGALFAGDFLDVFDHDYIIFADDNFDEIHTAGVRGLLKQANLWEAMELI